MTAVRARPLRATIVGAATALLLVLALAPAASAQTENPAAEGSAYGAEINGLVDLGPLPEPVTATVTQEGTSASDSFLEVPVEPVVFSATLEGDVAASFQAELAATLQSVIQDASGGTLPESWNARGHAITEDLAVLFASEEQPLLTADVVESEAVATCTPDGEPVFATGSRVQNLTLAGQQLPLLDAVIDLVVEGTPNENVLGNLPAPGDTLAGLGLEIEAWDTNWDGDDGTTDGSDTVWVDALRVSVTEGSTLGGIVGAQNVVVSHAEASVDCDQLVGGQEDPGNPLDGVTKEGNEGSVAPGSIFAYTITVPNSTAPGSPDACTLENVQVTDAISGPEGSTIERTDPAADTVDGLTATWNDIGSIDPGEQEQLTIEVQVPDNEAVVGETYRENLDITADCDGQEVTGGGDVRGPQVAVTKDGDDGAGGVDTEPVSTDDGDTLPATGGGGLVIGLALLGAGALAAAGRRLLRS